MSKILTCAEVDPSVRCDYIVRGETEEEVFQKATEHAKEHGVTEMNPELTERLRTFIHDE